MTNNTEREVKIGKLYHRILDTRQVIAIIDRYYYRSKGHPSESESHWRIKYYFIDNPDSIGEVGEEIVFRSFVEINENNA